MGGIERIRRKRKMNRTKTRKMLPPFLRKKKGKRRRNQELRDTSEDS